MSMPQGTQNRRFSVQGMSCAACVAHVERLGARVPGVASLTVNLATAEARLTVTEAFDPALFTARLSSQGYDTQLLEDNARLQELGAKQRRDAAAIGAIKRNMWLAAALTLPIFIVEMGSHAFAPLHYWLMDARHWLWPLEALLTLLIILGPGREFFTRGFATLRAGAPDMNALVALGAGAAFMYSLVSTFAPGILQSAAEMPAVYFEAAAVIMTLVLVGRWLEARARAQSGDAVNKLLQLQPASADRLDPTDPTAPPQSIAVKDLMVGDRLMIKPGARIALDGRVLAGRSTIDQSAMTGESLAVAVAPGDSVIGGTLNQMGAIQIEVTHASDAGLLANIIATVAEAQAAKVPIQALADRITQVFVPVVLLIALLTFAGWYGLSLMSGVPDLARALVHAVAVLIIACPCAMGLATPTAIMVATGRAAQLGILYRDGARLQALADIRDIAFDKTGTLTEGKLHLSSLARIDAEPHNTVDDNQLLQFAASLEAQSEHPIAAALINAARERSIALLPVEDFHAHPGEGISGVINGQRLRLGNARFMATTADGEFDADLEQTLVQTPNYLNQNGQHQNRQPQDSQHLSQATPATQLWLMIDDRLVGIYRFTDRLKPDAEMALNYFRTCGIDTAMISGDNHAVATSIAAQLGITRVFAPVLPAQKAQLLGDLKTSGAGVAFVGDGINDAPALAAADVGIALGTGTDIAIDTADCVVMSGAMAQVARAHALAVQTLRIIKQNLFWAFAYNALLIPVAAGVFSGLGIHLSPMLAALAMAASSLVVIGNSLRLRYWQNFKSRQPAPTQHLTATRHHD